MSLWGSGLSFSQGLSTQNNSLPRRSPFLSYQDFWQGLTLILCITSSSVILYELSVVLYELSVVEQEKNLSLFYSLGLIISVPESQLGLVLLRFFFSLVLSLGVSDNLPGKAGPWV